MKENPNWNIGYNDFKSLNKQVVESRRDNVYFWMDGVFGRTEIEFYGEEK